MRVRFAPEAIAQIEEIFAYIERDSPSGARRVRQRIERIAKLLGEYPGMAHVISDEGVHVFPVNPYPYLIFYSIEADEVVIVSVRHSARERPGFHEPATEFIPAPTF